MKETIGGILVGMCAVLALAYIAGPDEEPGAGKARMAEAVRQLGECYEMERKLPAGYRLDCSIKE